MEADWSVELAADDPLIVVPWQTGEDPPRGSKFIDLRERPWAIGEVGEAARRPALRAALLALNSPQSKLWTAKCDVWSRDGERGGDTIDRFEMDASPGETEFSAGSYVDILSRNPEISGSFAAQEGWIRELTAELRCAALRCARTDFVLRRAEVRGIAGYGVSWFVEGCGAIPEQAVQKWAGALVYALQTVMNKTG